MSKNVATTTQSLHPWRAVVRTGLALVIALAAMAPLLYGAVTQQDPAQATGAAGGALAIAGAITRLMALPTVEVFLQRFFPWLAAGARGDAEVPVDGQYGLATREALDTYLTSDPDERGKPGAIYQPDER